MKTITIGLLECDHVRPELRSIEGDYREMFPSLFSSVSSHVTFLFYDVVNGVLPDSPESCDGYITTGSSFSVYDDEPWIHAFADFVRTAYHKKIPFVGICFGHQMLGFALGGLVRKASVGWCVGRHEFAIAPRKDWMTPYQDEVALLMMCQDQVISLPPEALTLASTPDCPHAMILIGDTMLGIQAHPEFTTAYDKALMELRVERIGTEKVEKGIASLALHTSEMVVARWIINFFINLRQRN